MKICIDGRLWFETGVGRYIRNLVAELAKLDQSDSYFVLLLKKDFGKIDLTHNFTKIEADFRWYTATEQIRLPKLLNNLQIDLVHFPHFNVPLFYQGKFVVTIHDLIHQHFQTRHATTQDGLTYKVKTLGYRHVFNHAAKGSQNILVPSQFVKKQLIEQWQISQAKITVTPEGVEKDFLALVDKTKNQFLQVSQKYQIQKPFIFYVGNAHPHKNIPGLIKAYQLAKKQIPQLSLVLSGPDNYFWKKIKENSPKSGIVFTGYVSEEELVMLYQNAAAFVMPSFEEGFGIPILEAMAAGCPVISSNAASLPEVGGNAIDYFDPHNEREISQKIINIASSQKPSIKTDLIQKQLAKFSWTKLAQTTLEVYRSCT
ncbi:glycosyltransferase family 4 protein [Patescibacteria group bacterium]|nr:glycosyltransferase family 4 protein [Patescibacteria group bacterium]MCL5409406.1 glycosyltransferase family 4 protein [Patescibacteria group bacterium]